MALSVKNRLIQTILLLEHWLRALRKRLGGLQHGVTLAIRPYPENTSVALEACQKVDQLQATMGRLPQIDIPVTHRFTPGLYARQVDVPAGVLIVTKIHKTEHPFVLSGGEISVWIDGVGVKRIKAPFTGITKSGTRRVCYTHTPVVWTTFHATNETDPEKIEDEVIFKRELPEAAADGQLGLSEAITQITTGGQPCLG